MQKLIGNKKNDKKIKIVPSSSLFIIRNIPFIDITSTITVFSVEPKLILFL